MREILWEKNQGCTAAHHVSVCEEQGDKDNLDNGEDGDPEQEDVDQGMVRTLWHRPSDGSSKQPEPGERRKTDDDRSWVSSAVQPTLCASLLPELSVCMWRGRPDVWLCATVPWVSIEQQSDWGGAFPSVLLKAHAAGL